MICSKLQALLIEKKKARSAKELAAIRAKMREHVCQCSFCSRKINKR